MTNMTQVLQLRNKEIKEQQEKLVHEFLKTVNFEKLTKEIETNFGELIEKITHPVESLEISFQLHGDEMCKNFNDNLYNISERIVISMMKKQIEAELELRNLGNFKVNAIKIENHGMPFISDCDITIDLSLNSKQFWE